MTVTHRLKTWVGTTLVSTYYTPLEKRVETGLLHNGELREDGEPHYGWCRSVDCTELPELVAFQEHLAGVRYALEQKF